MTEIVSTTTGYFPRPDYLIETLKDTEGYQKEGLDSEAEKRLDNVFDRGRREVLEVQEKAGIDIATEGQLAWDDILAFPATRVGGIEMGGIIRFYDNNRYYRKPIAKDELKHSQELTANEYRSASEISDNPVKAVLPGPYSLADLSKNEFYDTREEFVEGYAEVVNQELEALSDSGAETVQLDEPSLTQAGDELDLALEGIKRAIEGTETDVHVYTYFGDVAEAYPRLLNIADGIGLDLVSGEENLEAVEEYGCDTELGLGVLNSRNTRLESVDELISDAQVVLEEGDPEKLLLGPNCGLDFLPWTVMEEKVERLGEATRELRDETKLQKKPRARTDGGE